jgi:hypothetical protein
MRGNHASVIDRDCWHALILIINGPVCHCPRISCVLCETTVQAAWMRLTLQCHATAVPLATVATMVAIRAATARKRGADAALQPVCIAL